MKVQGQPPIRQTDKIRAKRAYQSSDTSSSSQAPVNALEDVASIMGIPEAELTPKVREAILSLVEEVQSLRGEVSAMRSALAEAQGLADQDALLPLYNRRAFLREMSRVMAFAERYQTNAALIFFDLNGFKKINDEHGHAAGDAVLHKVGEILMRNVRSSDVVGRLGGDEFGVLLARANVNAAKMKAEQLVGLIDASSTSWNSAELKVSAAFGIYIIKGEEDPAKALEAADKQMYKEKRDKGHER